jgi:hypothetical protein
MVYAGAVNAARLAKKVSFPFRFEKNGRTGKIYKLGNGTFKTYFRFGGEPQAEGTRLSEPVGELVFGALGCV